MAYGDVAEGIHQGVRVLVAVIFGLVAVVALTHWSVRRKYLHPFGAWPRLARRLSDPLLRPVERRLARAGGNPQDAPVWLLVGSVVGGLVLIGVTDWLLRFTGEVLFTLQYPQGHGPAFLAGILFNLLSAALFVRIVASWVGVSPHARWMRPVRLLTDWILNPIRRLLPATGPLDFSPMVAWFLLAILRGMVLNALR